MLRFFLARLIYSVAVLVAVSVLVFAVTELLPGSVAHMILGMDATPEAVASLSKQLGLDRPAPLRLLSWLGNAAIGDFGDSLRMQRPIAPILAERLWNSLVLTLVGMVIIIVGGLLMGLVMALSARTSLDRVLTATSVIMASLPEFVTGTVLVFLFGGGLLRLFPPSGYEGFGYGVLPALSHLALPALSLSLILMAYVARIARTSIIDTLELEFVRTARLKGIPERKVLVRHVLPNALVPTITVLCMNLGWIFGGIVVVEEIFVFPGIGRLMLFAVSERDWPLIQATAVVIASFYVFGNLLGDILVGLMNPRLRTMTA
ncbi:ABC transporter permease [Aminobacter sp. J44]|uniref:ABC transporter permease n=1 Tax=Aminobacter sp. J44 TaxID=935262 RepID=UPI00119C1879|nr:ABC transporter permease [Aminobacter sp. J44]TWG53206.1 peptide/nickel transport system permease protein [Aminobacter sp. J44]